MTPPPDTLTTPDLAAELGIEDELLRHDDSIDGSTGPAPDLDPHDERAIDAEVDPERLMSGRVVLPSERATDDLVVGQDIFLFDPGRYSDGSRLIRGVVRKIVPYDFGYEVNGGSPGFASLTLRESPHRVNGVDLNRAILIPAEAMEQFPQDPLLLEQWLAAGQPEDLRMIDDIREAILTRLEAEPVIAEPIRSLDDTRQSNRLVQKPRRPRAPGPIQAVDSLTNADSRPSSGEPAADETESAEVRIAALREDYINRAYADSLYVMSAKEERALLGRLRSGEHGAFTQIFEQHRGLVAFFVEREHANGHSAELLKRGEMILQNTIRDFQAVSPDRLADAICEALDEQLLCEDSVESDETASAPVTEPETSAGDLIGELSARQETIRRESRDFSDLFDTTEDGVREGCGVAWNKFHRTLSESSNPYME